MLEWVEKNLNMVIWLLIIVAVILIVMKCMQGDSFTGGKNFQKYDPSKPYRMYLSEDQYDAVISGKKKADVRLENAATEKIDVGSKIQFLTRIDAKGTKEGDFSTKMSDVMVVTVAKTLEGEEGLKSYDKGKGITNAFPGKTAADLSFMFKPQGWYDEEKKTSKFRYFEFKPEK